MDVVLAEKCFNDFVGLIHELTGITIGANRTSMIEGRLRKRLVALQLKSYEDYLQLVRRDRSEQVEFINLVTTNETSFFRTPRIWSFIENKFLPAWIEAHPKKILNIWSAAASSGEEAHSAGILCEDFKSKHSTFRYQIIGTDISEEMVALGKSGVYSGRSIEAFRVSRPELFSKYMREVSVGAYQASSDIRSRLKFQQHNLFQILRGAEKFDLILIRNVLIYFKGHDQEKVIANAVANLANGGALIIGESESLSHINTDLKAIEPLIYRFSEESFSKGQSA